MAKEQLRKKVREQSQQGSSGQSPGALPPTPRAPQAHEIHAAAIQSSQDDPAGSFSAERQSLRGAREEKAATPQSTSVSAPTLGDPFKARGVSGYAGAYPGETLAERRARQEREIDEFLGGTFRLPLPEWTKVTKL